MLRLACASFVEADDVLGSPEACNLGNIDSSLAQEAADAATDIVYVLTGGLFTGVCTAVKRPVRRSVCRDPQTVGMTQNWSDYYGQDVIPLPANLISVNMITIDDDILAASDYRLYDRRFLARTDAKDWPSTNRLYLDPLQEHTFEIQFSFGTPPDWLAVASATEIAVQLLEDDANGRGYLRQITSASVQGASVTIDKAAARAASSGLPQTTRLLGAFINHGGHPAGVWVPGFSEEWALVDVTGPSGS